MRREMKWPTLLVLGMGFCLGACGKRELSEATDSRRVTMRDENLKLDVSSNERFGVGAPKPPSVAARGAGNAPASPLEAGEIPESWTEAAVTSFRLLNYRFGSAGEVYLSLSRGGVLENANRWLNQFGKPAIEAAEFAAMEKVEIAGFEGVWVEVEGDFGGGMGKPGQADYALAGLVAEKDGRILTVKMIGPAADVAAEKENLRKFAASLAPAE